MDGTRLSGYRFAGTFRTDEPSPPIVTGLRNGAFAAARMMHSSPNHGISDIPGKISAQDDYTSDTSNILDVDGVKKLLLKLDYIRESIEF